MLINSYEERQLRKQNRHQEVLKFLRTETWTTTKSIQMLLGCTASSAAKTLAQLEKEKCIFKHQVKELNTAIWGITSHGLAFAWNSEEAMEHLPYFEPSKLSPVMAHHHLDVQIARIRAQNAGWQNWIPGPRLPKGLAKIPDAVATNIHHQKIAIELERHIKTLKRYEAIFAHYLQCIKKGEYHQVHYICPDERIANQLQRVFNLIQAVPLLGERVPIEDKHRARLPVFCLSNWP